MKLVTVSLGIELINDYNGSAFVDWDGVQNWAKPYIAALFEEGIVYGSLQADGLYVYANNPITREEMITIVVRALGVEITIGGKSDATDFIEVSDWAKDSVAFALENEMINIDTDGSVCPARNAKRDETAMILYKLLQYREQNV